MNPILIAAAVIPAVVLLVRVYKADKLDREPPGLLVSLVLFGILSTFLAIILEEIGGLVLSRIFTEDSVIYNFFYYFAVVAVSEEVSKYFLLKLRTWKSPHFNAQFDGVVYAVFVSLGFALWENILYVLQSGISTAIVRAVTAVPGHASFGVFMGIFYGAAKRFDLAGDSRQSQLYRRLALLFPVLMHGTYDFIATLENALSALAFIAFILGMFVFAYRLVKRTAAEDRFFAQPTEPYPGAWNAQNGQNNWGVQNNWNGQNNWGAQNNWNGQTNWNAQNNRGAQTNWDAQSNRGAQTRWDAQTYLTGQTDQTDPGVPDSRSVWDDPNRPKDPGAQDTNL